jgi:hypothetical protein
MLPKNYLITMITLAGETTVTQVELSADQDAHIPLQFDRSNDRVVLVVSGATRYTRQPAAYRFKFEP